MLCLSPRPLYAVLLLVFAACPLSISADDAVVAAAVADAQRAVEIAQLRLRLYEREEYPKKRRALDRGIELAQAHLDSAKRRVKEYEQFDKFKYSAPLFISLEDARLTVIELELKLQELRQERFLLIRHHSDRCRLYQLEVEAAAAALKALRGK